MVNPAEHLKKYNKKAFGIVFQRMLQRNREGMKHTGSERYQWPTVPDTAKSIQAWNSEM